MTCTPEDIRRIKEDLDAITQTVRRLEHEIRTELTRMGLETQTELSIVHSAVMAIREKLDR